MKWENWSIFLISVFHSATLTIPVNSIQKKITEYGAKLNSFF